MSEFDLKAFALWALLDDIDTLDDACRSNDSEFRELARQIQQKRFQIMSGEEWDNLNALYGSTKRGARNE